MLRSTLRGLTGDCGCDGDGGGGSGPEGEASGGARSGGAAEAVSDLGHCGANRCLYEWYGRLHRSKPGCTGRRTVAVAAKAGARGIPGDVHIDSGGSPTRSRLQA